MAVLNAERETDLGLAKPEPHDSVFKFKHAVADLSTLSKEELIDMVSGKD